MSATYYWYRPKELDRATFDAWIEDCRRIVRDTGRGDDPVAIRGPYGTGEPILTEAMVALNGDAESGLECEPFALPRILENDVRNRADEEGRIFRFCKVAGRPYDKVVARCLAAFENRFGDAVRVEADAQAHPGLEAARRFVSTFKRQSSPEVSP